VVAMVRDPSARVQLIVCADGRRDVDPFITLPVPIRVPSRRTRTAELPRIVDEYAADAIAELKVPETSFTAADRQWVESIRAKHDPEAKRIAAHFTLVFPAILPLRETEAHVAHVAQSVQPMRFVLRRAAAEFPAILDIHEVVTGRVGDKLQVSCHCTLPDDMPMQQVHEIITGLEDHLKLKAPEISRVLIHPEPATDNRH